ncbi:MAG TPA: hypothetical protein VFT29_09065 [Gemmatimonadaceae bacterium]|nr:hypothetical protein [Gemmatimonadaceae bacterium]
MFFNTRSARSILLFGALALATGCREEPRAYRGPGLQVAALSLNERVGVYRAALGGSFRIDDPSLSILADPLLLPRSAGLAGGDSMPAALLTALRDNGVVKGTCSIPVQKSREALVCTADRAGYAVRFSDPFALGRDSVQVNLVVEQYAIPYGPRAERLRFERAYHVAKRGGNWRAVREARLPQP